MMQQLKIENTLVLYPNTSLNPSSPINCRVMLMLWFSDWVMSDSATPRTVAHHAPLSMGFPRQEYWSGLPFPSPGDLPDPGIEPSSPALAGRFFTIEPPGNPLVTLTKCFIFLTSVFPPGNESNIIPTCLSCQSLRKQCLWTPYFFEWEMGSKCQVRGMLMGCTCTPSPLLQNAVTLRAHPKSTCSVDTEVLSPAQAIVV